MPIPLGNNVPPRMREKIENPASTDTAPPLRNNARVGADNDPPVMPDGLGGTATTRAGRFERNLRHRSGVADQPQYQPIHGDGFDR
jgi:hypothetical protein